MLGNVLSNFTGIISFNPQYILEERQPQPLNEAVLNSKHTHVPQKEVANFNSSSLQSVHCNRDITCLG